MIRWSGGYMAIGDPVGSGDTATSPVWVSGKGTTWQGSTGLFGPSAVVVGMGQAGSRLVVLTLQGGPNSCSGETRPECWTLAGPLTAWKSLDGAAWTSGPGPDLSLVPACDTCGVDVPIVRYGKPGVIVISTSPDGVQAAISPDGFNWDVLPPGTFPADFSIGDAAPLGTGFIAVGGRNGGQVRAAAFLSSDGRTWEPRTLPFKPLDPGAGASADTLFVGPDGLIAEGSDGLTPGRTLWWTSPDGRDWTAREAYPPLGVWHGEGEGSGLMPDGNLLADGTRMIAYRDDGKVEAWTSADGRAWDPVDVKGAGATAAGSWPILDLDLLPVGLLWHADDGTVWFGQPGT